MEQEGQPAAPSSPGAKKSQDDEKSKRKAEADAKRSKEQSEREEKAIQSAIAKAISNIDNVLKDQKAAVFLGERAHLKTPIENTKDHLISMRGLGKKEVFAMVPKLYFYFDGVDDALGNVIGKNKDKKDAATVKNMALAKAIKDEMASIEKMLSGTRGLENYGDSKFIPKTAEQGAGYAYYTVDALMNSDQDFVTDHENVRKHFANIKNKAQQMVGDDGQPVTAKVKEFHEAIENAITGFQNSAKSNAAVGREKAKYNSYVKHLQDIQTKINTVTDLKKVSLIELPDDLKNPAWAQMTNENPLFSDVLARIGQTAVTPEGDPQVQTASSLPRKTNPGRVA